MPATANTVPVQPYETRESVLLARARDFIRDVLRSGDVYVDETEAKALEYDIDAYLVDLAQNAVRRTK